MRPPLPSRLQLLLVTAALLTAGWAQHAARRHFVQALFVDGPRDPAALSLPTGEAGGLAPIAALRVVLIDGLGAGAARGLPAFDALCRDGLELAIDCGFPTVSLPVQHGLWSGLTQQQSGVMYRQRALAPPPRDLLPARVSSSVAVAEAHPEIIGSFGFTRREPGGEGALPEGWQEQGFARAAAAAVLSPARLAFVHMLRVDAAGHHDGAASATYREAARTADQLLGQLVASRPPDRDTRWFVLADHGHRPRGGHGDAEAGLRIVRGCVAGGLDGALRGAAHGGAIHLVDLSRALADSAGVGLAEGAQGRPLLAALAQPAAGATLPRPGAGRWIGALLLLLAGLGVSLLAARALPAALPWGWIAACLLVAARGGLPTLSNPVVWPRLPWPLLTAAAPALLVLAPTAGWALRRLAFARVIVAQLGLPAGALAAALALCGGGMAFVGLPSPSPPLVPLWTGVAMALAALNAAYALALALLPPAAAWRARRGR